MFAMWVKGLVVTLEVEYVVFLFQTPPNHKVKHREEERQEPTPYSNHSLMPSALTSVRLSFVIIFGVSQLNGQHVLG